MISRRDQVGTRERRDRLRLTFAYRSYSRTFALPRAAFVISILALPLAGVLYLAATCYFIFHDNMLASLTRHQVEMRYAYEDRIAALRRDLENVTQHAQADQADLADRFRTLSQREDQVESRTALVAALADRIKRMRVPAATSEAISSLSTEPAQSAVTSSSAADVTFARPPLDGKPHPEGFVLSLRRTSGDTLSGPNIPQGSASAAMSPIDFETDLPIATRLDDLVDRYDRVDRQDLIILADLQQPANRISGRIRTALASAGLVADRLTALGHGESGAQNSTAGATGGPFVPLPILSDGSPFASAAGRLQNAIDTADKLRRVLPHVPLAAPLPGDPQVTSAFGPRIDPFLGRPALHTGVDLRDDYGAPVRATAAGTVTIAGPDGGYGNMVEIDHGNGLATRYAHLSSVVVAPGQSITAGTILGHIGATGRATGPHLHYEVRIDGEPVDPERFLKAGAVLVADTAAALP